MSRIFVAHRIPSALRSIRCELGESPVWLSQSFGASRTGTQTTQTSSNGRLLFVDVLRSRLFVYRPPSDVRETLKKGEKEDDNDRLETHELSKYTKHVSAVVPTSESNGEIVMLGVTSGFARYNLRTREYEEHRSNPIHALASTSSSSALSSSHEPRANDGRADPMGRMWLGTLVRDTETRDVVPKKANVFVLDKWTSTPRRVMSDVTVSNGMGWFRDKMYYTDSATCAIDVMMFRADASLDTMCASRARAIHVSDAYPPVPDGMAIDSHGFVWSALFGGGCVRRYDPASGRVVAEIRLPKDAGDQATAVAFGGARYDEMYITTAHEFWSEKRCATYPTAGCVYHVSSEELRELCGEPVVGIAPYRFQV